jgi:hypothetical protein
MKQSPIVRLSEMLLTTVNGKIFTILWIGRILYAALPHIDIETTLISILLILFSMPIKKESYIWPS